MEAAWGLRLFCETIMAPLMEKKFVVVLVALVNFVTISQQASSAASDSYVAAVVEYAPVSGATLDNKDEIFMQNVRNCVSFMEEAARQGADILVFPEYGLASMGVPKNPDGTLSLAFYVPEPGANPCNDNSSEIAEGLRELSCAARRHALYVVVNLPERVTCSGCPCPGFPATVGGEDCPASGAYFHNTNVAFDRSGNIVARYRKFNLFGESGLVPTQEPEFAIFETDFGVRFAMFTCFDIMFEKPAVSLARDHGVCDFAFTTAWFSEAPFLTAVQTQAAWAYSLDVNLLAAGYNEPDVGSAGSGIFLGRNGSLQSVMPNTTTSRLLVGTVPKLRRCQEGRSRRAAAAQDGDTIAVGRTPLSALHHTAHQNKYGHLDGEDVQDQVDDSTLAFIHRKMYEQSDEAADSDDDSQPPTGEYESKVPLSSFMGLPKAGEAEQDEETDRNGGTIGMAKEVAGDTPENKIPGSTITDHYDEVEPKRLCKPREKRESECPTFRGLDDGRVTNRTEGLFLKRDHLEVYKTFALTTDSHTKNSTVLLCDGAFCCNFNVVLEVKGDLSLPRYTYRLAVFNGVRTFDGLATGGLQVCGLIPCSSDDVDSCGTLTLPDEAARRTMFRSVSVSGSFSSDDTLVAANTAVPGLLPLPADRFEMTAERLSGYVSRVTLRSIAAVRDEGVSLLSFAIYSRLYGRDGQPATTLAEAGAGADPGCH